jgi:hypothetical protein
VSNLTGCHSKALYAYLFTHEKTRCKFPLKKLGAAGWFFHEPPLCWCAGLYA